MSQVKSIFTQGYLSNKDLFSPQNVRSGKNKRPEFWGFQPDQASGNSMLPGSESQNPAANRDMANALFGRLGQGTTIQNTSKVVTGFDQLLPVNMPQLNTGTQQTQPNSLQNLLTGGMDIASKAAVNWGGGKINDYLFGPKTYDGLSPEMQGFAGNFTKDLPEDAYKTLAAQFGLDEEGTELLKKGVYDKLMQEAVRESTDELLESSANAAATESIPWVGSAMKLGQDLLNGNLSRNPGQTIGSAGGALGGAMLGQALIPIPGVGAAIGGMLGGAGGGFLDRSFGRLFR